MAAQQPARTSPELRARLHSARANVGITPRPGALPFDAAETVVKEFVDMLGAEDISITPAIGQKALVAARTYGKHVGHEADLNFGDCFSYACAIAYDARLIYKGNDFAKTDLR